MASGLGLTRTVEPERAPNYPVIPCVRHFYLTPQEQSPSSSCASARLSVGPSGSIRKTGDRPGRKAPQRSSSRATRSVRDRRSRPGHARRRAPRHPIRRRGASRRCVQRSAGWRRACSARTANGSANEQRDGRKADRGEHQNTDNGARINRPTREAGLKRQNGSEGDRRQAELE